MSNATRKRQQLLFIIGVTVIAAIASVLSSRLSLKSVNHTTRFESRDAGHIKRIASNVSSYQQESASREPYSPTPVARELDVPIYLIDPSSMEISVMEWKYMAHQWNRNTTYSDILQSNLNVNSTISFPEDKKLLIFHHLNPKTASSTLRQCCQDNQFDLCGIQPPGPKLKHPAGYMSAKRLMEVIQECPKINHYCLQADIQPLIPKYSVFHNTTTFLHLFPFRNYDEWAVSALKQIYFRDVRDGKDECTKHDKLLDKCLPHKWELAFERYPKSTLVFFLNSWKAMRGRINLEFETNHKILMYDYRYLAGTLKSLNEKYQVPLLPGTDAKENSERPEGTCKDAANMLKKFHDCFSDALESIE